jgi:hypothetical protein
MEPSSNWEDNITMGLKEDLSAWPGFLWLRISPNGVLL